MCFCICITADYNHAYTLTTNIHINLKRSTMKTLRSLFFLAVLTTAVIAESKDIKTFSIYETSCNGERESIGIDKMPISFSWKTASEKEVSYKAHTEFL